MSVRCIRRAMSFFVHGVLFSHTAPAAEKAPPASAPSGVVAQQQTIVEAAQKFLLEALGVVDDGNYDFNIQDDVSITGMLVHIPSSWIGPADFMLLDKQGGVTHRVLPLVGVQLWPHVGHRVVIGGSVEWTRHEQPTVVAHEITADPAQVLP